MIYTYGNNGTYQTGFLGPVSDDYGAVVLPPDPTPPRARHPIGVNQPPNGGNDYPFVRPSPDIQFLLGDFYLSYPDDTCSYEYPFRIEWMYGFGDKTVTPPTGYPIPANGHDILIKDANNATVFDSCLCGVADDSSNVVPYVSRVWYDRLLIIEWTNASKDVVCRCSKFIGWDSYSTDYQDYGEYIVPAFNDGIVTAVGNVGGKTQLTYTANSFPPLQKGDVIYVKGTNVSSYNVAHTIVTVNNAAQVTTDITYLTGIISNGSWQNPGGILDPRTSNKLPLRVRSLTVRRVYGDLGTVLQGDVSIQPKYNIDVQVNPTDIGIIGTDLFDLGLTTTQPIVEGSRVTNHIAISAVPGAGVGAYPSCNPDDTDELLRRLNSAIGDDKQNVILDPGDGCIRLQRPLELVDDCPRSFEFNDTSYIDTVAPHVVRLINDCSSCCDCDYFARTYQGLKRQWSSYQTIADDATAARDQFKENVTRWDYQKLCRENNPVVIVLRIMPNCTVDVNVTYGNTSACCLVDVHMRLTFEYFNGVKWIEFPLAAQDECFPAHITSSEIKTPQTTNGPVPYEVVGQFPVVDITTEHLPASSTFQSALKLCFPGCSIGSKVKVTAFIWWESTLQSEHTTCHYPDSITLSQDILDIWNRAAMPRPPWPIPYGVTSSTRRLNDTSAFCKTNTCKLPDDCEEE